MENQGKWPLVLFRVPAFNHEAYIQACLESIAADDYPNKLVVVNDDCSTDKTAVLAEKLCLKYKFIFRKNLKNKGLSASLNEMTVDYLHADYFFGLASDDILISGGLTKAVCEMESNLELGGVYASARLMDVNGADLGEMRNSMVSGWIRREVMLGKISVPRQWILWRRKVIDVVGLYDPDMPLEDAYYFNKAAKYFQIGYVDTTWVRYRQHANNSTRSTWRMYEASKRLTEFYKDEDFYPELLEYSSLNWWMLLASDYPSEARRYIWMAARRWRTKLFVAGLLCYLRLGFIVEIFRRR